MRPLEPEVLDRPAPDAAAELLGAVLARTEVDGTITVARIVETEAYRQDDPASHSAAGRTRRTAPMFGPPGTGYVYRSYGIHWCCNVTAEGEGVGAAVLLRAAIVLRGADVVRARRGDRASDRDLLRGPGRLCRGLDVDAPRHDGEDLLAGHHDLWLATDGWRPCPGRIAVGPRVGVRLAPDRPWRFWLRDVPEVSAYRRHPRAPAPAGRGGAGPAR